MNLVPLDAAGGAGEGLAGLDNLPGVPGQDVVLGVRPEHMRLVESDAHEPGEFLADLTVTGVEVVGAESYVFGALAERGPEIAVRVPGYSHLEPGTKVKAAGRLDAVHRFEGGSGRRLD